MITIFNRRELYITFRPEDYARVKDILRVNGISHYTKFHNQGTDRNRRSYAIGGNHSCQYTIYVHRDDYDRASRLIHQR